MQKQVLFLLLGALLFSCQDPLSAPLSRRQPQADSTVVPKDTVVPMPDFYQTALCFPDTVNWRAGDTRAARLLLLKNGKVLGGMAAGDNPSPESHRFSGGHLWTDTTDGTETVVTCDGEEAFRYSGEERLQGLVTASDGVHTLGQRPGGGLSYRIDGREVFSSSAGIVLGWAADPDWSGGALQEEDGCVYYCYGIGQEYHFMCGDRTLEVLAPQPGTVLLDAKVLHGTLYRLERRYSQLFLVRGEEAFPLGTGLPDGGNQCKLAVVDGEMLVKGHSLEGDEDVCWLRGPDGIRYVCRSRRAIQGLYAENGIMAAMEQDYEGCILCMWCAGKPCYFRAETYRLSLDRCAKLRKGWFAAALTADEGPDHVVQLGPDRVPVRFNGYFTGIYSE